MKRFMLILSLVFLVSCSVSKVPESAVKTLSVQDEIVISGGEEVAIKVIGIKGDKGDPGVGEKGEKGDPGPKGDKGDSGGADKLKYIIVTDYPSIQAAVDAASTGDTILFPAGNYTVTSPIKVAKNINISGAGHKTQIYQASDENLFEFTSLGGAVIEGLHLGSAAKSQGKSLMKLSGHISRTMFKNIFLQGAYYGIHSTMVLESSFEDISAVALPFFEKCSRNTYWIYIDKAGSHAPNGLSFFNLNLSSPWGTNGIFVKSGNSEGGIALIGGTIEGLSGVGAEFVSIGHYLSITDMHFEACSPAIRVTACSNVSLRSIESAGSDVEIRGCNLVNIENLKVGRCLRIDENTSLVGVDKTKYHDMDVRSQLTQWGLNMSDRSRLWGGGGFWSGPFPYAPMPPVAYMGWVDKDITAFGRNAVYRIHGDRHSGLSYRYKVERGEGSKVVRIRVHVYREKDSDISPRLGIYGGGGGTYIPLPRIPIGEWVPINAVLYTSSSFAGQLDVRIVSLVTSLGESCLLADPLIIVE